MKLIVFLISGLALLAGCSEPAPPAVDSENVTLSGVINTGTSAPASAGGVLQKQAANSSQATAAGDLTGHTLYCVTFTEQPKSATGNLTDNGNDTYGYSVTLTDAAGLPIGCFINDAANQPVTTITFSVDTNLNDSSGSTALTGGDHTVDIVFDQTTGTASATVTAADVETDTAGSLTAAQITTAMAGSWELGCADTSNPTFTAEQVLNETETASLTACERFLMTDPSYDEVTMSDVFTWSGNSALPIYTNIISASQDGSPVHAMSVWSGVDAYTAAGSTEAMSQDALNDLFVTGVTATSGTATGSFPGIHTTLVTEGAYAPAMNATTGEVEVKTTISALKAALDAATPTAITYDESFDDLSSWGDHCIGNISSTELSDATWVGAGARSCYLRWFEEYQRNDATAFGTLRIDNKVHDEIWDGDHSTGTFTNTNPTVVFRTKLGGVSPEYSSEGGAGRFTLMGMDIIGDTAVAFDEWSNKWTEWTYDSGTDTSTSQACFESQEMMISFIPDTTSDSAVGRFTISNKGGCGTDVHSQYDTFDVNFIRPAAP